MRRTLAGIALVAGAACIAGVVSGGGSRKNAPALAATSQEVAMPAPPPLRVSARASTGVVPALPTRTRAEDPALHEAALAQFAAIRAVPGAAPLVDDIVEYIRRSPPGTVSLARLPRAPNGLAVLDARASDAMIPDPEIRRKWDELARLLRSHASRTDHPAR